MQTFPLLIYHTISKRVRGKLFWLGILLLLLGLYDLFIDPFLGEFWFVWWLVLVLVVLLWFYYAVLMRRAKLIVRPEYLKLQGPLFGVRISYGRVRGVKATQYKRHVDPGSLSGSQRKLIAPFWNQTCAYIPLKSLPRRLRYGRLWFSPFLLSEAGQGLLLSVPNWMDLSRAVDAHHQKWKERHQGKETADKRTLVGKILDW